MHFSEEWWLENRERSTPDTIGILATEQLGYKTPIWLALDLACQGHRPQRLFGVLTVDDLYVRVTTLKNLRMSDKSPKTLTDWVGSMKELLGMEREADIAQALESLQLDDDVLNSSALQSYAT